MFTKLTMSPSLISVFNQDPFRMQLTNFLSEMSLSRDTKISPNFRRETSRTRCRPNKYVIGFSSDLESFSSRSIIRSFWIVGLFSKDSRFEHLFIKCFSSNFRSKTGEISSNLWHEAPDSNFGRFWRGDVDNVGVDVTTFFCNFDVEVAHILWRSTFEVLVKLVVEIFFNRQKRLDFHFSGASGVRSMTSSASLINIIWKFVLIDASILNYIFCILRSKF